MDAPHAQLFFMVGAIAAVAVIIFEFAKAEFRDKRLPCICGHLKKQHVYPGDADSKSYWPHAEFDPWQCRQCRCRQFITGQVPAKVRERRR